MKRYTKILLFAVGFLFIAITQLSAQEVNADSVQDKPI